MKRHIAKKLSRIVCGCMAAAFLTTGLPFRISAAEQQELACWTEDGMTRISQKQAIPAEPANQISLQAARNEYENGQIVLYSETQDFTVQGVEFTPLVCGANTISTDQLEYKFELYSVDIPTDTVGKQGFGEDGGPLYPYCGIPDALSNESSMQVKAGENQPILVRVHVPEDTVPGIYSGRAVVRTSLGDCTVPIRVEVFEATVPSVQDAGFTYYNWMSDIAQGYWTEWNVFDTYYKVEDILPDGSDFTPEFYKIVDSWADSMYEHRQNMVCIHTIALLDAANSTVDKDGVYTFDWTLFDKYVSLWLENGMTRMAGIHYGYHDQDVMLEDDGSGNASFAWKAYSKELGYDMEKDTWYRQYLPQLARHLAEFDISGYPQFAGTDKKTLLDIWCQQLYDEPTNTALWTYYAKLTDRYFTVDGQTVPVLDADMTGATRSAPYTDYMDIYVPQLGLIPGNEQAWQALQQEGKELWAYVCLSPSAPWLNRFVHQPDTTYPLLFWYEAQVNATGYLHWALNVWNVGWYYDGDSYLVYPDVENQSLLETVRFEGQRDGVEDWELIQLARQTSAEKTSRLLKTAVNHPNGGYVQSVEDYRALRTALLQLASGDASAEIPDVSAGGSAEAPAAPAGAYYVDNLDPAIQYSDMEAYEHTSESESYRKSVHFQNYDGPIGSEGGSATLDFTGTGIEFMSETRANKGDVKVELFSLDADGNASLVEEKTVSCLNNTVQPFYIAYRKTGLDYGQYRIRVTNIRTENAIEYTQLVVDAFIVHTMRPDGTSDVSKVTVMPSEHGQLQLISGGSELVSGDAVRNGDQLQIIAVADEGYYCRTLNINGAPVAMQNGRHTVSDVQYDMIIAPTFETIPPDVPQPENVALNRKVTASSVDTVNGFSEQAAVDGITTPKTDGSNGWANNGDSREKDVWLMVELDEPTLIDQINLFWDRDGTYSPAAYQLQVSQTGEEGSFVTVVDQPSKQTEKVSHTFEPVEAKFVRLWVPQDPNASWVAILLHEIQVMSSVYVPKTELDALIAQAESLSAQEYTEYSWNQLTGALENARQCSGDQYATQADVQEAMQQPQEKIDALQPLSDAIAIVPDASVNEQGFTSSRQLKFSVSGAVSAQLEKDGQITDLTLQSEQAVLDGLEDGTYTLLACDAEGKWASVSFTVDGTAPVISGAENGMIYYDTQISVTVEDAAPVQVTHNDKTVGTEIRVSEFDRHVITAVDAAGNQTVVTFDLVSKAELYLAIAEAAALDPEQYSPAAWAEFEKALERAQQQAERQDITAEQVQQEAQTLRDAIAALQRPEPTATPAPTEEPVPTATPDPTQEPVPTASPAPTQEPVPTVNPDPTKTPQPDNGDTVLPSTGDNGQYMLLTVLLVGGIAGAVILKKKKRAD